MNNKKLTRFGWAPSDIEESELDEEDNDDLNPTSEEIVDLLAEIGETETLNSFCPTGEGVGTDPTCPPV